MDEVEEKRKYAVAIKYETEDRAPKVIASGAGEIAKRILEIAKIHNIPVQEDDDLVRILSKIQIGYEIPPQTYKAVAEILAFLYRTDINWRKKREAMLESV
ncbi:MAG: EscU/YscU/HrcU family type III secretion system export apparatus switch protein [Proteobacteria bacterium]|nr:EscU/YscU/HrcU family type III secretion system export apparatus switch protein [Pseudomonadota bacterium]